MSKKITLSRDGSRKCCKQRMSIHRDCWYCVICRQVLQDKSLSKAYRQGVRKGKSLFQQHMQHILGIHKGRKKL